MSWDKQIPAKPVIAVCGATGAVGREMLKVLEQRDFPLEKVRVLASARSAGTKVPFSGKEIEVEEMTESSFRGVDIALFAAGGSTAESFKDSVVSAGAVMIDNSSAFRMTEGVPLIVPEVNPDDISWHSGVIANPNCSTIQMVVALKPLYEAAGGIKRVVVSTYQAASGAGAGGMRELYEQTREFLDNKELTVEAFAHQIAFNTIPHIDVFHDDLYTKEEWKMVAETKKIFGDDSIEVAPTCVRVPVLRCHAESINVELKHSLSVNEARAAFESAQGVKLMDDPSTNTYPMPGLLQGTNETYVGRVRLDPTVKGGLAFWCVADQIRKGAALNAVQIAELLIKQ